jgi:hypothetical protein
MDNPAAPKNESPPPDASMQMIKAIPAVLNHLAVKFPKIDEALRAFGPAIKEYLDSSEAQGQLTELLSKPQD